MTTLQGAVVAEDLGVSLPCLHALHALPEAVVVSVLPAALQAASWVGLHTCGNGLCP